MPDLPEHIRAAAIQNPKEGILQQLSLSPTVIEHRIMGRPYRHSKPDAEHPDSEIFDTEIEPGEHIKLEKFTSEPKTCVTWIQPVSYSDEGEETVITWIYVSNGLYAQVRPAKIYEMQKYGQKTHDPQAILGEVDNILARLLDMNKAPTQDTGYTPQDQGHTPVLEGLE